MEASEDQPVGVQPKGADPGARTGAAAGGGRAAIRRKGGSATIYDVAELAGVNPSTVSRAFSKPGRVSAATEARIRAAAAELNFRPNPIARALPTGKTLTIGLVVADVTNPVVFGIIRGAERAASAAGYVLLVAESQESGEVEATAIERLMPGVDGIVLATTRLADERITDIAARKPVVLLNRSVPGVPGVLPDVGRGVDALVDHLAGLGHRSIVFVSGPAESWISARRWEAIMAAAGRHEMAVVEIGSNLPTVDGGRAVTPRVLAARPSAVIAFNDLIAMGILQAAGEAGVSVPGDLSVAGFDDIFGSDLITPALTTVRSQLLLAGERAVKQLLGEESDGDLLRTELVVRASTAAAPGR